jgi:hypothetical protein
MLLCYGTNCPLALECYHHTQPNPGRDAYSALPYDFLSATCAEFVTNEPSQALIQQTAYYIWLRNGRPANFELEHWNEAFVSLCISSGRITEGSIQKQ